MAGIGFQLKNLVNENSFFGGMKAFVSSTIVVAGPMVMCILLVIIAQSYLNKTNTPYFERELFLAGILYCFIFSQLISGGFSMLLTRYLADQLYADKKDNVLASLFGMIAIVISIGGISGIIFYAFSPLDWMFKISSYLFFIELIIVWILSLYISSLKKYFQIIASFLIGITISATAILICYKFFNLLSATQMFFCLDLGFFMIILLFFRSVIQHFPINNHQYFDFLAYFEKYPSLFVVGLIYNIGLYGHIFIVWGSELKTIVSSTFVMVPHYEIPIFYSYLTILPAMIMFVVSVETSFYEKYKIYYSNILGSGSLQDIKESQSNMFKVLSRELIFIMEVQLFITILAIVVGTRLLPLTSEQIDIFNIVTIGNYFFIMMFVVMQILLYFDDRKGALIILCSYVFISIVLTSVTLMNGSYGVSCFYSGLLGFCLALARLRHYSKNLDYYTFCSQPLVIKEEIKFMKGIADRLNSLNGVSRGKYEAKK